MTEPKICTCPSGDGSLRWPCPKHPAVEQAGGDERAAFNRWIAEQQLCQGSDISLFKLERNGALVSLHELLRDAYQAGQDRAALAQPSPAQSEQHWPKLEKPAQVGAIRFRAGLSSRLVVEAAQRLYEFESTPEKEAERIERLHAFREQCFEPLGAEFSKVLSENLVELSSEAKHEQAEAEAARPEVVATMYVPNEKVHGDVGFKAFVIVGNCDKDGGEFYDPEKLMTVDQHDRIVGALRADRDSWAEQAEQRLADWDEMRKERDAALARVAEMERQEPVAFTTPGMLEVAKQLPLTGRVGARCKRDKRWCVPLYTAPAAQAQHSVPGDIMRDAQRYRWLRDQQFYFSFSTENSDAGISSCTAGMSSRFKNLSWVDAAIDSAIAAAPGKEGV
ncbi:TPA: hypothetical protein ACGXR6_000276 [Pseudomonas aeruginosa]